MVWGIDRNSSLKLTLPHGIGCFISACDAEGRAELHGNSPSEPPPSHDRRCGQTGMTSMTDGSFFEGDLTGFLSGPAWSSKKQVIKESSVESNLKHK